MEFTELSDFDFVIEADPYFDAVLVHIDWGVKPKSEIEQQRVDDFTLLIGDMRDENGSWRAYFIYHSLEMRRRIKAHKEKVGNVRFLRQSAFYFHEIESYWFDGRQLQEKYEFEKKESNKLRRIPYIKSVKEDFSPDQVRETKVVKKDHGLEQVSVFIKYEFGIYNDIGENKSRAAMRLFGDFDSSIALKKSKLIRESMRKRWPKYNWPTVTVEIPFSY